MQDRVKKLFKVDDELIIELNSILKINMAEIGLSKTATQEQLILALTKIIDQTIRDNIAGADPFLHQVKIKSTTAKSVCKKKEGELE